MNTPIRCFNYCPQCGADLASPARGNRIQCGGCGFCYYFNPTVSAAAIVLGADGQAVLMRRSREPAKGKLTIPGGFVDFGETAEEALRRETREEVGLELEQIQYLCSGVNAYEYQGITYPVVDLFFVARATSSNAVPLDGAESVCWIRPVELDFGELAFASVRQAFQRFLATPPPAAGRSAGSG